MKKLKLAIPLSRLWRVSLWMILLLALVLTGAMCEEEERRRKKDDEDDEEEELKDYTLYENEKWNFKIYYPKDWGKEIVFDEPEGVGVGFTAPAESPEDYFLEGVVVIASAADPNQGFDELMTKIINEIQEGEYWELVDYSKKMIGEYMGYKIIYIETYYAEETKYLHYFVDGGDNWYQILYGAENEVKYNKYLEQVEIMVNSFEIIK